MTGQQRFMRLERRLPGVLVQVQSIKERLEVRRDLLPPAARQQPGRPLHRDAQRAQQ